MELTAKQKQAYELMKSGANVFLTGEAGTGKSFVLNQFLNKREDILVCAPTGIAAINVKGATLHRTFKVPLRPIGPEQKGRKPTELILRTKCFVIDEISMCRFDVFHFVAKIIMRAEEMARTLNLERGVQIYPEKKQIICCGDFFQLPPVITDRDREVLESLWGDIGDGFAFRSPLWEKFQFQTVMLDEVMRQKKDSAFVENLNYIRKANYIKIK